MVGASGSGKSSLVAAGLLPRLPEWLVIGFKPGAYPFKALVLAVNTALPGKIPDVFDLHDQFRDGVKTGADLLEMLPKTGIVFFVDQFEEIFDPKIEAGQRTRFVELLKAIHDNDRSFRAKVVVTLREDFLGHCLALPHGPMMAEWLRGQGMFPLALPDSAAMREMIVQPAAKAGLMFEIDQKRGSLALHIEQETAAEPGRLALMAYLLSELFGRRDGQTLTWQAYDELGGVAQVVGRRANEEFDRLQATFATLNVQRDKVLAQVFRKLVRVDGQTGSVTRQRAGREELCAAKTNRAESSRRSLGGTLQPPGSPLAG